MRSGSENTSSITSEIELEPTIRKKDAISRKDTVERWKRIKKDKHSTFEKDDVR